MAVRYNKLRKLPVNRKMSKHYNAIVAMAERLPEETIQEDSNLLMYYDISLSRAQSAPTQIGMDLG